MSVIFGNLTVFFALAAMVSFAVRSLWKEHRQGSHCSGDCTSCGGCHSCQDVQIGRAHV